MEFQFATVGKQIIVMIYFLWMNLNYCLLVFLIAFSKNSIYQQIGELLVLETVRNTHTSLGLLMAR